MRWARPGKRIDHEDAKSIKKRRDGKFCHFLYLPFVLSASS